ncbi:MAG: shikimate dehydrogenase [Candidatus Bathyarchaeia archaeon]
MDLRERRRGLRDRFRTDNDHEAKATLRVTGGLRLRLSAKTKLYAVIGDPVEHSLSPAMHNAAFESLGLNAVYLAFRVEREILQAALSGVRALGILGLNVTMPLKTDIVKYLDELGSTARFVQAVNTVVNREGKLIGFDTDGVGALKALASAGVELHGLKVTLLGAGGAAKAIAYHLVRSCRSLAILNRSPEKALTLAELVRTQGQAQVVARALTRTGLEEELRESSLVINATSVGMKPQEMETPIPRELLRPDLTVFDLVYNPVETRLLIEARERGAATIDGLSMLVHQGAESFRIWTGREPPLETMMQAVRQAASPSRLCLA